MNISNNILDGTLANQAIIIYSYSTETLISNNIIRNALRGIIYVQPETVASQQIQIVGNNIADTSYEGIEVRGVKSLYYCKQHALELRQDIKWSTKRYLDSDKCLSM